MLFLHRIHAAPFRNLDFEEANTNSTREGSGPITDLLPGWQIYEGTNVVGTIGYNYRPLGIGYGTLIPRDQATNYGPVSLSGNYAIYLLPKTGASYSLVQRGDIPADARALAFVGFGSILGFGSQGIRLEASVNGTTLTFLTGFQEWDVSAFAGQTAELKLTLPGELGFFGDTRIAFDSLYFVPEPTSFNLFGLVGLSLVFPLVRRRFRK